TWSSTTRSAVSAATATSARSSGTGTTNTDPRWWTSDEARTARPRPAARSSPGMARLLRQPPLRASLRRGGRPPGGGRAGAGFRLCGERAGAGAGDSPASGVLHEEWSGRQRRLALAGVGRIRHLEHGSRGAPRAARAPDRPLRAGLFGAGPARADGGAADRIAGRPGGRRDGRPGPLREGALRPYHLPDARHRSRARDRGAD